MKPLTATQIALMCGGRVKGDAQAICKTVCTDTRALKAESLFVALRGERFDAHDFVAAAFESGVTVALVDREIEVSLNAGTALIFVEDTLAGLQRLAHAWRRECKAQVIAVTGSNGKSSTKEMIASVLSQRFRTHKTQGNLNNHIGLPLTLLGIEPEHEFAVVEAGMNHPGELAPLAALAQPDIAVVTNVGWGHVEAFDNQDAIAQEKSQLVQALASTGVAILNGDDARVRAMSALTKAPSLFAGAGHDNAFRYDCTQVDEQGVSFDLITPVGSARISLPLQAPHLVSNATLAAAVAVECGATLEDVARGLNSVTLPKGRCHITRYRGGWLIDDTYNASPDSMLAAIEMVRQLPGSGRNVALLGAMGELGQHSRMLHEQVGKTAVERGIGLLFALGKDSKFTVEAARNAGLSEKDCAWFEDHASLTQSYRRVSLPGDRILIKGSRSQKMEQVVVELASDAVKERDV